MTIRPPEPDDVPGIHAITAANGLPAAWRWPEGKHGLVVEGLGRVLAFCVLYESVYGLVIDELWEEPSRPGYMALAKLSHYLEEVAQRLANERGAALAMGGVIRLDKERHINALRRRGYSEVATVMERAFLPQGQARAIGEGDV
jgi:hypothetical protein